MGRLLPLTIGSLGIALAGENKPDFSGTWTLNLDSSNFGKSAKPNRVTLVTRDGEVMHAVQTTVSQAGPTESDWVRVWTKGPVGTNFSNLIWERQ